MGRKIRRYLLGAAIGLWGGFMSWLWPGNVVVIGLLSLLVYEVGYSLGRLTAKEEQLDAKERALGK